MYELYFSNIPDRGLVGSFTTLDAAKVAGRKYGFEFTVRRNGSLVGWYEIFGGWRAYR